VRTKFTFFILVAVFAFQAAKSQTFTVSPLSDSATNSNPNGEVTFNFEVVNNSANADTIVWDRIALKAPGAWQFIVTDPVKQWDHTKTTSSYSLGAGDSTQMKLTILPNEKIGKGTIEMLLFDQGDSAATVQAPTFVLEIDQPLGVSNVALSSLVTATPNPAHAELQIQTHNSSFGIKSVSIYSLTGQLLNKISQQNTFSSEATIPVVGLPEGYYFATIQLTDGTSVTRRFTKE
jgi:hypothetical protein